MLSVWESCLFLKVLRSDQRWHDLHFSGSSSLGSLKQSGIECVKNANPFACSLLVNGSGDYRGKAHSYAATRCAAFCLADSRPGRCAREN
jgi:hypothetical protein